MPKSGANMKIEFDPETPTAVQESLEVRAILGGMLIANIEEVWLKSTTEKNILQYTTTGYNYSALDIYRIKKLQVKLIKLLTERFNMSKALQVLGI